MKLIGMQIAYGLGWPLKLMAGLLVLLGFCAPAFAQTLTYSTFSTGAIDDSVNCSTANRLTRTINVPGPLTVEKLNVGFLATHSWRGDIVLEITPPDGAPTVQIISSDVNNANQDNYNIELDSAVTPTINNAPHDTNDSNSLVSNPPPAYENLVAPSNSLAVFTGENATGDWTLSMCDDFLSADDGQFEAASLFFISNSNANLSLVSSASATSPAYGTTVNLNYTVQNTGPATATNVDVSIPLPAGLDYSSHSGGTYDDTTGQWDVGTLASGNSITLTLTALVQTGGGYTVNAEISNSDQVDPNSTPGNNSTSEDDDSSLTLSPFSATVPGLSCPIADQFSLNWTAPGTTNGWGAGDLTNSYTAGGETLDFDIGGDTGTIIARDGITMPATTTEFTGGTTSSGHGLVVYVDFTSPSQEITIDIDLGTAGTGVGDVQFAIYDVDLGGWTDRIRVDGFMGGTSVFPILTPSTGNTVSGNAVIGTGGAASNVGNGNMTVTFNNPVDRVLITYDNTNPAADPARQVISLQPLTMCPPQVASLTATKTVEMYDPSGTGGGSLYAIPGNEILYTISVENAATATASASDIKINDVLPENLRFLSASVSGFSGGSFTAPALPSANTDCAAGACIINYEGATLSVASTGEIEIRAVVK